MRDHSGQPSPITSLYLLREQQREVPENVMQPAVQRRTRDESVVMMNYLSGFSMTVQFEKPPACLPIVAEPDEILGLPIRKAAA
jgi:hypothetical protein